jgi:hypothetical protein
MPTNAEESSVIGQNRSGRPAAKPAFLPEPPQAASTERSAGRKIALKFAD